MNPFKNLHYFNLIKHLIKGDSFGISNLQKRNNNKLQYKILGVGALVMRGRM